MNLIEGIQQKCNQIRNEIIPQYQALGQAGAIGAMLLECDGHTQRSALSLLSWPAMWLSRILYRRCFNCRSLRRRKLMHFFEGLPFCDEDCAEQWAVRHG